MKGDGQICVAGMRRKKERRRRRTE